MIIRIARRIEIAGMCPPIADLLGRDPADPGNFLIVSDLESVFLRFPHQKIPDILSLSGCWKYPAVFFLRDSRDPVFFEKRDQFQVIVFIEAAADTAAFFPIPVDEILDGSAVGDIALAAAGHQKFRAGAACFLQDQASLAAFGRRIKSGAGKQAGCAGADDNAVVNHAGEFLSLLDAGSLNASDARAVFSAWSGPSLHDPAGIALHKKEKGTGSGSLSLMTYVTIFLL